MDNKRKGITFAIIANFFFLGYWIFAPFAFKYFNTFTLTVLWFGSGAIMTFIWILIVGKFKHYSTLRTHGKWILLIGIINSLSILTAWEALRVLGPSLTSFLSNIEVLFLIFFGVILLKEKFNFQEILSSIIVILGVFMISFSKGEYILYGIILILVHALFFALNRTLIKSKLKEVDALFITHYRTLFTSILILIAALLLGQFKIYLTTGLFYATLPAIFSAVLGHLFTFKAYKLIEMSKTGIINALLPLLVLISSYLVFGNLLTILQASGGLLILIGVIGLIIFRKKHKAL